MTVVILPNESPCSKVPMKLNESLDKTAPKQENIFLPNPRTEQALGFGRRSAGFF